MKNRIILLLMLFAATFTACAPDDMKLEKAEKTQLSSACDIEAFTMAGHAATVGDNTVTYIVKKGYAGNMKFTTRITVSDGATVTPAAATNQDFSAPVQYTVTAQNGQQKVYTVKVIRAGEGLYVNDNLLMQDGHPYYGVGVNYFDLFYRAFTHGSPMPVALTGLQILADKGIPVVRFAACPYWPLEWKESYMTDKASYFAEMDKVVKKAEELGIGLIPTLFWNISSIPDAVGEHMNQLSNTSSQSLQFIRTYTQEVVSRYAKSPAILGWEFSAEFSLQIDLPNKQLGVGTETQTALGQPATRDAEKDLMTQKELQTASGVFVEEIRKIDATRPIFSGNSIPRPEAYNHLYNNSWSLDNREQFSQMLALNESKFNTLSTHVYFGTPGVSNQLNIPTISGLLTLLMRCTSDFHKPMLLGEFGVSTSWYSGNQALLRSLFEADINAIVENKVQISCAWNYDRVSADIWTITASNTNSYMLDLIGEANNKLNE